MPKIIVKTNHPTFISEIKTHQKPGYDLVKINADLQPDQLPFRENDIHAVIADADLITSDIVRQLKVQAGEEMFPVILLSDKPMTEPEVGKWIACGISDIFQLPMSAALMARHIGSVIQLYCLVRSLHGQVTDQLTGLYNRGAFFHFAKEMITRDPDANYMIIMSDIEYFKRINERAGEDKGDMLLRYIGRILGSLNNENTLFARYGGDQFVGMLRMPEAPSEAEMGFVEEGMRRLYAEAPIQNFNVQFGVYENIDKSLPISIMCDRALMALKTIKHQYGRNIGKYTPLLQQRYIREQQIISSMEEAVKGRQFEVYYQPKHDVRTEKIVGAEALVRWNHPVYGFMSPADFVPLFEKSGFITKMDAYVWNQVCMDMRALIDQGQSVVPVSVNFCRKDLAEPRFIQMLKTPMEQYHLDPQLLHLELTESVYMEDEEILAPLLKQLKEIGIRIELDDFGSGFSSLGVLHKLPVDIIKLDISLIRNLEKQPVIVESILHMMRTLGYQTTAEGVDHITQVDLLRTMNCDTIQGYYYSKPLTLNGFNEYLTVASELKKTKS